MSRHLKWILIVLCVSNSVARGATESWGVAHDFELVAGFDDVFGGTWDGETYAFVTGAAPDTDDALGADLRSSGVLSAHVAPAGIQGEAVANAQYVAVSNAGVLSGSNGIGGVSQVLQQGIAAISSAESYLNIKSGSVTNGTIKWNTTMNSAAIGGAIDQNVGNNNAHQVLIDPVVLIDETGNEIELFSTVFEADGGALLTWEDNFITITQTPEFGTTGSLQISIGPEAVDGQVGGSRGSQLFIEFEDGVIARNSPNDESGIIATGIFERFVECNEQLGNPIEPGKPISQFEKIGVLFDESCNQRPNFNLDFDVANPIVGMELTSHALLREVGRDHTIYHDFSLNRPDLTNANEDALLPGTAYFQVAPGRNDRRPAIVPNEQAEPFEGFARANLSSNEPTTTLLFDREVREDNTPVWQLNVGVEFREFGNGGPGSAAFSFGLANSQTYGESGPTDALDPSKPQSVDGLVLELDPVQGVLRLIPGQGIEPVERNFDPNLISTLNADDWNRIDLTIENRGEKSVLGLSLTHGQENKQVVLDEIVIEQLQVSDLDRLFVASSLRNSDGALFDVNEVSMTRRRRGDLNWNTLIDINDLDLLDAAVADSNFGFDAAFDFNFDGQINGADVKLFEPLFSGLLMGDLDMNGLVDFPDFLILAEHFTMDVMSRKDGDIDGNGTVDFPDFLVLSRKFGTQIRGAEQSQSVPEPASPHQFCCVFLCVLAALGRNRVARRSRTS